MQTNTTIRSIVLAAAALTVLYLRVHFPGSPFQVQVLEDVAFGSLLAGCVWNVWKMKQK